MNKLISEMTPAEYRLAQIVLRRQQNAVARRLGFRNFKEWQGEAS